MTRVIAVLNQKGGSGKTTIATNLTHCLCLRGYKSLLVDADPQRNARDWTEPPLPPLSSHGQSRTPD